MIELEARITEAAGRLPGPDHEATDRARAHVLAAFAPPGDAPATADPVTTDLIADDTGQDAPRPVHRAPRGRRILALGTGLAVVAALAAAVVVAGLPHRATPTVPPAGTSTVTVAVAPFPLDGVLAFLRGNVLYAIVDGGEPREIARLPAVTDPLVREAEGARSLAVSADGSRIAVITPGGNGRPADIYDIATGAVTTVPLSGTYGTSQALFSPDGAMLFVRGRFDLFAVTDRARDIPTGASDNIAVAPDGSGLAVNGAGRSGLVVFDSAVLGRCDGTACVAGRRTIARNLTGGAGGVVWGPGEDQPIAYVDGAGARLVSAATPGAPSLLLGPDLYPLTFTPDGRELIVTRVVGPPLVEAIAIERHSDGAETSYTAGPTRRLATINTRNASLGMTGDGKAFLVDTGEGPQRFQLVPVDGGPAQPIGIGDADVVAWSGATLPPGAG